MTISRDIDSDGRYEWTSDIYTYPIVQDVVLSPPIAIRIEGVYLLDAPPKLDVTMVMVANVMLARFSKYTPVCYPDQRVTVHLSALPNSQRDEFVGTFRVRIVGKVVETTYSGVVFHPQRLL